MANSRSRKKTYQYFSVAADVMALRRTGGHFEVLLIQRKHSPYQHCWALPGGFLDRNEDAITAARREFKEETGLTSKKLVEFGSFSDPLRDPRGRVVTISFYTLLTDGWMGMKAGDDAAEAAWFRVTRLPKLAFDHREMIRKGLSCFHRDEKLK
jgi:8-oxo-dGTP diphosphatase